MKREIKFRGKRIDKDVFVFGDMLTGMGYKKGKFYILPHLTYYPGDCNSLDGYEVIPETVGQFTGLLDKNGKEIYEGDVIEIKEIGGYGCKRKGVVEYDVDDCAFVVRVLRPSWESIVRLSTRVQICADGNCTLEYINQYTVIGNIHDNPELLKTETL